MDEQDRKLIAQARARDAFATRDAINRKSFVARLRELNKYNRKTVISRRVATGEPVVGDVVFLAEQMSGEDYAQAVMYLPTQPNADGHIANIFIGRDERAKPVVHVQYRPNALTLDDGQKRDFEKYIKRVQGWRVEAIEPASE